MNPRTRALVRVLLSVTACISSFVGFAGRSARAAPDGPCEPCDELLEVNRDWRIRVVPGRETLEGKEDRAASLSVYRVERGQCCLARTRSGYPGVYLLGVDAARSRVFLGGHDARWAALATNGIWAYDLATGDLTTVASHIWRDVPCEGRPLRFAAILQADPPPRPGKAGDAEGPRPDPYRGTFRLVAFDLADRPMSHPIATQRSLSEFDAFYDSEEFAAKFHWSADCATLTYALGPKARTKTYTLPLSEHE